MDLCSMQNADHFLLDHSEKIWRRSVMSFSRERKNRSTLTQSNSE